MRCSRAGLQLYFGANSIAVVREFMPLYFVQGMCVDRSAGSRPAERFNTENVVTENVVGIAVLSAARRLPALAFSELDGRAAKTFTTTDIRAPGGPLRVVLHGCCVH